MKVSIKTINRGIEKQLKGYLDRSRSVESYLKRVTTQQVANIQMKRFMTQNTSEGIAWEELRSQRYIAWKKVHFGATDTGKPILIASKTLFKSLTDPNDGNFLAVTTPRSLVISTRVPYAKRHNDGDPAKNIAERNFSRYSKTTLAEIRRGVFRYMTRNDIRIPRAF